MPRPWVVRLSISALINPRRSSFSTSAPTIRIARPRRFRATISRPRREPGSRERRPTSREARSGFAVAVTDAIEGFDRIELRVDLAELAPHALDVAVDGAVVDIDLIVVGRVHQVVAAFDEAGALGQGLQEQELGHGQLHWPVVPQAVVPRGIEGQPPALDGLGADGAGRR